MAATIDEFLQSIMGLSPERIAELGIKSAEEVLDWTKDTCPLERSWTRLTKHNEELHKIARVASLVPWADTWKTREFLRRVTIREVDWTMNDNPYFPCVAYGVPMEACAGLGVACNDMDRLALAYVCDKLRRGVRVTPEEVKRVYPHGDPLRPRTVVDLTTHPLYGMDVDREARYVLSARAGIHGYAEFKRAQNPIELGPDGLYRRSLSSNNTSDLAKYIREYTQSQVATSAT